MACPSKSAPQRAEPSTSRKKAPTARRFFVNATLSRKENRAFPQRNLICQYLGLRGKSECAAFIFLCAPENAAQRENPAARRNGGGGLSFTSRKNDLSAQIIFRESFYFVTGKNRAFCPFTRFADTSAYGKGEAARLYIMCALKYRGQKQGSQKSQRAQRCEIFGKKEQQAHMRCAASFTCRTHIVVLLRRAFGFPLKSQ